jgi:hypothetical protein|tara:strand:- start:808 stop:1062 length:255 start_codon:yes stop_codon:yes gene_type:complete
MDAFVDNNGMAHDDEGNTWRVGARWAGYVGPARILPEQPRAKATKQARTVFGSNGQTYTVTSYPNGRSYCTCKGFQFRKTCKHI